jgi:hypothetical protein
MAASSAPRPAGPWPTDWPIPGTRHVDPIGNYFETVVVSTPTGLVWGRYSSAAGVVRLADGTRHTTWTETPDGVIHVAPTTAKENQS